MTAKNIFYNEREDYKGWNEERNSAKNTVSISTDGEEEEEDFDVTPRTVEPVFNSEKVFSNSNSIKTIVHTNYEY